MFSRRACVSLCVAGLLSTIVPLAGQGGEKYTARLSAIPIAGPNDRQHVTGKGSFTASLTGNKLTFSGQFEGLPAAATVARLHRGIAKGARGPSFADLTVTKAATGTVSGAIDLSPVDVENLKAGRLYVQLHSERGLPKEDGSTLWGWLLK